MRMLVIATAVFLGMALLAPAVTAAPFPERDISVIVPWAAGGGTDALARTLAKNGKKYFGVNVTVVNKVGGAGGIGMGSGGDRQAGRIHRRQLSRINLSTVPPPWNVGAVLSGTLT